MLDRKERLRQDRERRRREHEERNRAAVEQERMLLEMTPEERREWRERQREARRLRHEESNRRAVERESRSSQRYTMPGFYSGPRSPARGVAVVVQDGKMKRGPQEDKMLRPGDTLPLEDKDEDLEFEAGDDTPPVTNLLEGVEFASAQAEGLARSENLKAIDFQGVQPSGEGGYTVGDVRRIVSQIRELEAEFGS